MPVPERWLWLGGSLLLSFLVTQSSWVLARWERSRAWANRWISSPLFPPILQFFRFVYYIGLPFAALLWGHDALVERLLGLQILPPLWDSLLSSDEKLALWTRWVGGIGLALFWGLLIWGLLAVIWLSTVDRNRLRQKFAPVAEGTEQAENTPSAPAKERALELSAFMALREAIFHEAHWMFYRNGPVVALGTYWGTWAGLGVAVLEAVLNPWWRTALREPTRRPLSLVRAAMAVNSAVFYLRGGNLWLAILLHWGVTWGLAWLTTALVRQTGVPEG